MRAGAARAWDTLVGVLVASAVRRWPPALRDDQCREWTAELEALRGEPDADVRRFNFAVSLATSPAPDDGSGLRGWRELLPGLGARLRPAGGFAVLSLLALQAWPLRFDALSGSWSLPVGVLLAWAVVPLCYLIGLRSTMSAMPPVVVAGVAATGAALGYLTHHTVPLLVDAWVLEGQIGAVPLVHSFWPGVPQPSGGGVPHGHIAAALLFVAVTTLLVAGLMLRTVRRRPRLRVALACLYLPVAALQIWAAGGAASSGDYGSRFSDPVASVFGARLDDGPFGVAAASAPESFTGVLPLLGALVIAYGFGLAASRGNRTATTPQDGPAPEWTLAGAASRVACVASAVGLAAWVYATSMLPLRAERDAGVAVLVAESGDELRWGATILAILGARVAAAHRRGATLAALLLGGWLLTTEAVLTRPALIDGPLPVGTSAAITVVGVGLAWWASGPKGQLRGTDATAVRRALAAAAVVAAACGPLLIVQSHVEREVAGADVHTLVLSAVSATFVALAASAAVAARRRPTHLAHTVLLAVVPAAATAAAGVAATATDRSVILLVGAAGAGLFAVGAAALALARRGSAAYWGGWAVAMLLAPFVLAPAAFSAAIVPGMLLEAISGADAYPVVTTSFQPGVLLVVSPAAAALARWLTYDTPPPVRAARDDVAATQPTLAGG